MIHGRRLPLRHSICLMFRRTALLVICLSILRVLVQSKSFLRLIFMERNRP